MYKSKSNIKDQRRKKLNAEGRYLRTQILSNTTNRILAYNNLEGGYSETFNKQLLKACACRKSTHIEDMKLKGSYSCKYRFCIACARYRSVKQRLAYAPAVDKIYKAHKENPKENANLWFVTLTKPTVKYEELPKTFTEINRRWRLLYTQAKKQKLKNFSGIRKLECTTNPIKTLNKNAVKDKENFTYHAHLHILVHGRINAVFLRREWLKQWPKAEIQCQDIRKFNGNIAEVLKYVAKLVHGHDAIMSRSYAKAIGWIYNCLRKRRVFFTFGAIKKVGEEEYKEWEDEQKINTKDILDELTDEERQAIRPDKIWAEGQEFIYDKITHNYVADGGLKLVDKRDLDLNDPTHFSQKKLKAIRKFDRSLLAEIQEEKIKQKGKKKAEEERDYIALKKRKGRKI